GSIWAQGLSGSAALQMATPGALQPRIRDIVAHGGVVPGGLITFRHTIFLWQSIVSVLIELAIVTTVMWLATPPVGRGRTAADLGIDLGSADEPELSPGTDERTRRPGAWLEHSPLLARIVVLLGVVYLIRYFMRAPEPLNAITLNVLNLAFLL